MRSGRVTRALVIISIICVIADGKVFTRCQLTRELLKMNFSRTFISNWVCLIEKETNKNTSAVYEQSKKKYYGLFHIGSEWCKEGKRGGKCNITCESLLDDDITDDAVCANKVFELEGFKYWPKWQARCKGQPLPEIEKCPDWRYPPPPMSRASPPRTKRRLTFRTMFSLY